MSKLSIKFKKVEWQNGIADSLDLRRFLNNWRNSILLPIYQNPVARPQIQYAPLFVTTTDLPSTDTNDVAFLQVYSLDVEPFSS